MEQFHWSRQPVLYPRRFSSTLTPPSRRAYDSLAVIRGDPSVTWNPVQRFREARAWTTSSMLHTPIQLLSWNVNSRRPPDLAAKIESVVPHIVTLQEVERIHADDWAHHLKKIGLAHHYRSGDNAVTLSHQCLIASRWPVSNGDDGWRSEAPYPESLGRAKVSVPGEGDIDVFTAHIPNWEGNGWKKIDTFHVLAAALRAASDSPRILTGDFNEPEQFLRSGQIVTFGENADDDGGTSTRHWRDPLSAARTPIAFRNGVLAVLGGESQHGLQDAYRVKNGIQPTDLFTWRKRCFDHTFVSRHFRVEKCEYYHEWREELELSDHSPMWVELGFRADRPD